MINYYNVLSRQICVGDLTLFKVQLGPLKNYDNIPRLLTLTKQIICNFYLSMFIEYHVYDIHLNNHIECGIYLIQNIIRKQQLNQILI